MTQSVGIGGSAHDFATCLITESGEFIAIEDERLSRVRYALFASNPCEESFRYVLDASGLALEDIRCVVGNDLLDRSKRQRSRSGPAPTSVNRDKFPPMTLLNHHSMHAFSTFFTSPFDEAAILVMDGSGSNTSGDTSVPERETMTYSVGRANAIATLGTVTGVSSGMGFTSAHPPLFNNSLGHLYRAVTQVVGFGWMNAGTTMGLAPYGDDRFVDEVLRYVRFLPEGQFEVRVAGKDGLLPTLMRLRESARTPPEQFRVDAALCYAVQTALEQVVFHALDYLWTKTQTPNLCLAGGVALNGMANGKITTHTNFKNVHVCFAPGDDGTALGAAIWDYLNQRGGLDRTRFDCGPFLGRTYASERIANALSSAGVVGRHPTDLSRDAAELIARGKTLAWFEGGSEFGPRALGHRSILADPRSPTMLDHINRIKGREWFRPLAPAVTEEAANTYFDVGTYSPYMQFVWPVREPYRAKLPAITHVDGGARIQSVRRGSNESLHDLLTAFERITGFPILINTSLNVRGAPIIETPEQAIQLFMESALDVLVIEGIVIQK